MIKVILSRFMFATIFLALPLRNLIIGGGLIVEIKKCYPICTEDI